MEQIGQVSRVMVCVWGRKDVCVVFDLYIVDTPVGGGVGGGGYCLG